MRTSASIHLLLLASLVGAPRAVAQGSDACSAAQGISGAGPHFFDTGAATTGSEGQVVSCSPFGLGIDNDVWFLWSAPQSGLVLVSTCLQTTVDTKIAMYPAGVCPTVNPIACSDDDCAVQSQMSLNVSSGSIYLVQVGSSPFNPGGTGTLTLTFVPPPTNDDCSQPITVIGPGPHYFDNSIATTTTQGQGNPGCVNVKNDLWYLWTAPANGVATLSTCGQTAIDGAIAVYAGAGCPGGFSIACGDDECNLQSLASWLATAGTTYTLQVGSAGGLSGGLGTFTIDLVTAPAHDDCATPLAIGGAGGAAFDTASATTDFYGQSNPCGGIDQDLWFEWTAPLSGSTTVDTCGQTALDTSIAVYTAGSCPQGTASACDDDGCGLQSTLTFPATVGSTYLLQIGTKVGTLGGPGSFVITQSGPTVTPFCFGDGSVTPCPCGNLGAPGQGCPNSVNSNGALLGASGTASVSADSLSLACSGMFATSTSLYIQGTQPLNGGAGLQLGDGLRCIGGTLIRLGTKLNSGGASAFGAPNGDIAISIKGMVPAAGGTFTYQVWYRDPQTFCTPNTFNLSNGLEIVWVP